MRPREPQTYLLAIRDTHVLVRSDDPEQMKLLFRVIQNRLGIDPISAKRLLNQGKLLADGADTVVFNQTLLQKLLRRS